MKTKRQKTVTLDLRGVTTEAELHQRIQSALASCGMAKDSVESWEALWNGMVGQTQMPRRLELKGWGQFQTACPETAKKFLGLMDDYNRETHQLPCKVVFGDGLSPALFWGPDIFLFALLPVEALSLIGIVGRFGWKMAVIALFVAIALVTQVIVFTCVLSVMQPHWPVTKGHQWATGVRTLISFLLFVGCVVGLVVWAKLGIRPEDGFSICAAALALAANGGYNLVLLRKRQ